MSTVESGGLKSGRESRGSRLLSGKLTPRGGVSAWPKGLGPRVAITHGQEPRGGAVVADVRVGEKSRGGIPMMSPP